ETVSRLLRRHMNDARADEVATTLSEGRWTHDFPIDAAHAMVLGLPVSTDLPNEVRALMSLYPQPRGRRPSVEYIPHPYEAPRPPAGGCARPQGRCAMTLPKQAPSAATLSPERQPRSDTRIDATSAASP